jgi:hypothetical protein
MSSKPVMPVGAFAGFSPNAGRASFMHIPGHHLDGNQRDCAMVTVSAELAALYVR